MSRRLSIGRSLIFAIASIVALQSPVFAIDDARRKAAAPGLQLRPGGQPGGQPGGARTRNERAGRLVPSPGQWTLGVRVDNLDTGVRITHVAPGTAAWRAGLERRDMIVSINGFQIGYVNRQLYDLGRELSLRADARGFVRLLVWNHRDGGLVNLDVALDRPGIPVPRPMPPRGRGIQGSVAFQATVTTTQSAVVVVQLLDITDRLRTPRQLAIQEIPFKGQSPVRFHLSIDPNSLTTGRRYELKAQLRINGRVVMESMPGSYMLSRATAGGVDMKMKPIRFDKRGRG